MHVTLEKDHIEDFLLILMGILNHFPPFSFKASFGFLLAHVQWWLNKIEYTYW